MRRVLRPQRHGCFPTHAGKNMHKNEAASWEHNPLALLILSLALRLFHPPLPLSGFRPETERKGVSEGEGGREGERVSERAREPESEPSEHHAIFSPDHVLHILCVSVRACLQFNLIQHARASSWMLTSKCAAVHVNTDLSNLSSSAAASPPLCAGGGECSRPVHPALFARADREEA